MNLLFLTLKNLYAKPLQLALNLLLLSLGVSVISLLLVMESKLNQQFKRNLEGINMVVGAKGSPLQLILSAVYHVDDPTGNIPLSEAKKILAHPLVKSGIPLAYGDSYQGYRIVGTETTYLDLYTAELATGRLWQKPLEVTSGAQVAQKLGLRIGDRFESTHGLDGMGDTHGEQSFEVVGVLAPTGTVLDQLLLTSVESLWAVHAHGDGSASEEITALLLRFRSPMGVVVLPRFINENTPLQAALPAYEISRLLKNIGLGVQVLQGIALAIILVSGISVFISLYTSLRERRYELALMRALGASRGKVSWLILQEGVLLSAMGAILGWGLGRLGLYGLSLWSEDTYRYALNTYEILPSEWLLLGLVLAVGFLAGLVPALSAYRRSLAEDLVR
ncbi:MAG: ABC transporter permease [Bernardetiaceae bacterium]